MKYYFTTNWRQLFIFVGSQFCFALKSRSDFMFTLEFLFTQNNIQIWIWRRGFLFLWQMYCIKLNIDFLVNRKDRSLKQNNLMFFFLALVFLAGGLSHIRPQMTQLCSKSCRNLQTTTNVFCPLFSRAGGKATLPFWIRAMPSKKLKRVKKKMCSHKLTDHFQLSPVSFPNPVATLLNAYWHTLLVLIDFCPV